MLKFRKILCLFMILAMTASIFAGCTNNANVSDISKKISAVKKEIVDDGSGGVKLPNIKLENKTVKFYTHLKETDFFAQDGETPKAGDLFKEIYGGKLEIVPIVNWGEYLSKLYGMYMSDDMPDMIQGGVGQFATFKGKDLIQPVTPYIDVKSKLWDGVRTTLDDWKWRGEAYLLPYEQGPTSLVYFNPKIFEENGMKTPLEYYKEGKWDWNAFRELAVKMTKDTNGDGKPDIYGAQMAAEGKAITFAVDSTGVDVIDTTGDYPKFNLKDSRIADAANYLRDLGTAKYNVVGGDFAQGTAAMAWDNIHSGGENEGWKVAYKDVWADGTVDFVPPPRYPGVDKYYLSTRPDPGILAKKSKNPQGAVAFMACMRFVQTDEYKKIFDPEGNWKKKYTDMGWSEEQINRAFVEIPSLPRNPWTFAAWTVDGVAPAYGTSEIDIKPWSQILQEVEPKHEASLKEKMDAILSVEAGKKVDLTKDIAELEKAQ